jgi:hypothetical protein
MAKNIGSRNVKHAGATKYNVETGFNLIPRECKRSCIKHILNDSHSTAPSWHRRPEALSSASPAEAEATPTAMIQIIVNICTLNFSKLRATPMKKTVTGLAAYEQ